MSYEVRISRKALKNARKMTHPEQNRPGLLVASLGDNGPVRADWSNYSMRSATEYHCHLSYRWVACRRHEKSTVVIEVYYAGSRENASY